jgi:hypothetical protein
MAEQFDLYSYLRELNGPSPNASVNVPYSPAGANGTPPSGMDVAGPGVLPGTNPYAWQGWGVGAAEGAGFGGKLGTFLGGNAKLFGAGADILSKGIGAYTGLQALSLAKKSFAQEKKAFNINLANQTQSYNTQVGDRIAGRSYGSEEERQRALEEAQLTDRSSYAKKGG